MWVVQLVTFTEGREEMNEWNVGVASGRQRDLKRGWRYKCC